LGNKGRWEYLRANYERYQKAGRKSKKAILSEFCANTGYHRKYAIRLLNGPRLAVTRLQENLEFVTLQHSQHPPPFAPLLRGAGAGGSYILSEQWMAQNFRNPHSRVSESFVTTRTS
jgi:hypothetical protein